MRYCFYSGYRDLKGGYTTLLLTLIKELYHQKQEVVLINFAQGLISDELKNEKIDIKIIDLDTLNWNKIDQIFFFNDIFILTKFEEVYRHLLKINPRAVYFDINDFICQISDYKFGIKFPSLGKKLIKSLVAKKSLFFMDDTGVFNLKQHFLLPVKEPAFLPIPVKVPPQNIYLTRHKLSDGTLHLTYIGRSVNWKMKPLNKILADCAASTVQKNLHVSIVVDDLSAFKKYINIDDYGHASNLSISVIENMLPSNINEFLLSSSDLHFAMGTAALDAAKLGVPTILVDYSIADFPEGYKYKWLFETTGYSLGRNLDKIPAGDGVTMDELLEMIVGDKNKMTLFSSHSYKYVLDKHAVDKIVPELISLCSNATFRIKDAEKLVPFYYNAHRLLKKITAPFIKQKASN